MGAFDKRKNFEDEFSEGDKFVLLGLKYEGTIKTREGDADLTIARVRTGERQAENLGILGRGIAGQARRAERSDFPCVVEYGRVQLSEDRSMKVLAPVVIGESGCRAFVGGEDVGPADYSAWDSVTAAADVVSDGEDVAF